MDMTVLNAKNRDYFNYLIDGSRQRFADTLPSRVTADGAAIPVSASERYAYVQTYVDELDLFGNDLLGYPLREVFTPCITEQQIQILAGSQDLTPETTAVYRDIWEAAYRLTMQTVEQDIRYDFTQHIAESMEHGNALDEQEMEERA